MQIDQRGGNCSHPSKKGQEGRGKTFNFFKMGESKSSRYLLGTNQDLSFYHPRGFSHPSSGQSHGWCLYHHISLRWRHCFWRLSRESAHLLPSGTSCRTRRKLPFWEEESVSVPSCPVNPDSVHRAVLCWVRPG